MKATIKTLIMLTVIFALALTACANKPATTQDVVPTSVGSSPVIAEGHLKPVHAANLSFQVRGVVSEINVKIGDPVKKGDVLARLANADVAVAQLAGAKLDLANAQYLLDTLNRTGNLNQAAMWDAYQKAQVARADAQKAWDDINPRDIEKRVDDQQSIVNDREKDLHDAQDEFDKYKDLDKENSKRQEAEEKLRTAQKDYDAAVAELESIQRENDSVRAALDSALAAEAESKHQYELSAKGPNAEQLAITQARAESAKAQVAAAQATLANYVIFAPFDGVVADVAVEIGEQVTADSRAVSVTDPSSWIVETSDITELEVVKLAVDQKATFTADALSEAAMQGVVTEISQSSITQGGDVIYTVRIQVDSVDPRIKWGMTVEVTFSPLE